jgi:aminopeptidase N
MMKNWLQKPGFPVIEVNYSAVKNIFEVSQQRLIVSKEPEVAETLWHVPLAASRQTDKLLLDSRQSDVKILDKKD